MPLRTSLAAAPLDEACCLHRRMDALPITSGRDEDLHKAETVLAGKKVLIVDDDIRKNLRHDEPDGAYQMNWSRPRPARAR